MRRLIGILILTVLLVSGCSNQSVTQSATADVSQSSVLNATDLFSAYALDATYDATATVIDFDTLNASSLPEGVTITDEAVVFTVAHTYILKGTLNNMYIKIDIDKDEKMQLVLDTVTINAPNFAAIYGYQMDALKLTLAENSTNILSNGNGFSTDEDIKVDGTVFSRDDLVINGTGVLMLQSSDGNGIVGKDDVTIAGGDFTVTSTKHGIEANDSVRIKDTNLVIQSGSDGIQAENTESKELGFVYIVNSNVNIDAKNDGIQSSSIVQIDATTLNVTTYDGVDTLESLLSKSDESYKGIKSAGDIILLSGSFNLNTADDSIHANGNITINQGTYTIRSLDDGIHADKILTIVNPEISIYESYEGLEAKDIVINGGTISIDSRDDGMNATDGSSVSGEAATRSQGQNPAGQAEDATITINGGLIVIRAGGDGIDSNGNVTVNAGSISVSAPANKQEGGLDYDGTAVINGGVVVITGSSSMSQNFANATQGSILLNLQETIAAGTEIVVKKSDGTTIIDTVSQDNYSAILISDSSFSLGTTLTIQLDDSQQTIKVSEYIVTNGQSNLDVQGRSGGNRRP